jgi:hypothetical protein
MAHTRREEKNKKNGGAKGKAERLLGTELLQRREVPTPTMQKFFSRKS